MGNVRRFIAGVWVEVQEAPGDTFRVLCDDVHLLVLTYTTDDGTGRWFCPCGHPSGKRDPMLLHVVSAHAKAPPLLTKDRGCTFEAMNTNLRLVGKHADPTYNQAIKNLYGSSW